MPQYFSDFQDAYSIFSSGLTYSNIALSKMWKEEFSYINSAVLKDDSKSICDQDMTKQWETELQIKY